MRGRRHSHRAAAIAAVLSLALVACGGDDDDPADGTGDAGGRTSTTATTVTTDPSATTAAGATATTTVPTTASAGQPPAEPPAASLVEVATVGEPLALAVRPGDDTLYLVGKDGVITAVAGGAVLDEPRLDISDLVSTDGEQGLLGVAFHPTEDLAYLNYTDRAGDTVIAELPVDAEGRLDRSRARTVLTIDQPYPNHNGGTLVFGPDGLLYIGTGDGGSGGDPERRSLDTSSLLGKMLRIDPRQSGSAPYGIPADNPLTGVEGARPEIWSIGLRNPWRFSFDAATGDLWIADVGQGEWEEIDVAWAADGTGRGASFGWSAYEADERFNEDQPADGHLGPIHSYDHDEGCSVSGGVRYRGTAIPALAGWYVFSDFCAGELRALEVVDRSAGRVVVLADDLDSVAAVAAGPDGELYVLSLEGAVLRLVP